MRRGYLRFASLLVTLVALAGTRAGAATADGFAALALQRQAEARQAAIELQRSVETFFMEPNDATLELARQAWRHAHNMHMMVLALPPASEADREAVEAAFASAEEALWGPDDQLDAPGNRPYVEFTGDDPQAVARRAALSSAAADLAKARRAVRSQPAATSHLGRVAVALAEAYIEAPLAARDPQAEPSRFSDNGLEDLRYAVAGLRQATRAMNGGDAAGPVQLLNQAAAALRGIHPHLDYLITAPADHPQRQALLKVAALLRTFSSAVQSNHTR